MGFRMVKIFLISGDLLKSKDKVKPQKLRNTFIPVLFQTHTKTVGGPLLAALAAAM